MKAIAAKAQARALRRLVTIATLIHIIIEELVNEQRGSLMRPWPTEL